MKNLTITVSESVAHRAKIFAAEQNTSVSRYLGTLLTDKFEAETGYQVAMLQWSQRKLMPLNEDDGKYPNREELYER